MNPFFYFTRQTKSEIYEKKKTPAHVYKIDEAPNCIQSPQPKRKKNTKCYYDTSVAPYVALHNLYYDLFPHVLTR